MEHITVFTASIEPLENDDFYNNAYAAATKERKAKADKLRFIKDKRLSIGAELILKYGLSYFGESTKELEFAYTENEKPYFKNRKDICFNISHSGSYVAAAFYCLPVGCDIEKVADCNLEIAKRFFNEAECNAVFNAEKGQALDLFYRYWTVKESFLKLTGLGLKLPLNSFCANLQTGTILTEKPEEKTYHFKEFNQIPGYKCAVAAESSCTEAELIDVDLSKL